MTVVGSKKIPSDWNLKLALHLHHVLHSVTLLEVFASTVTPNEELVETKGGTDFLDDRLERDLDTEQRHWLPLQWEIQYKE